MNYPVFEKIACPCHPDAGVTVEVKKEASHRRSNGLACEAFCHRFNRPAKEVPSNEHAKCQMLEVMEGNIKCRQCGRGHEITHGIARLMPDEFTKQGAEKSSETESKLKEMKMRNSVAERQVSGAYSELQTSIEIAALSRELKPDPRGALMDIGCGAGRLTRKYSRNYRSVIGVDFAFEMLRVHRQWLEANSVRNVDLVQADACSLPLRSGSVPCIFSNDVISQIPVSSRPAIFKGISRCLAPGGRFFITVRSFSLTRKMAQLLRDGRVYKDGLMKGGGYEIHFFTKRDLLDSFAEGGLEMDKIYGIYCGIPRHPGKAWERLVFVENAIQKTPISLAIGNLYAAVARKRAR